MQILRIIAPYLYKFELGLRISFSSKHTSKHYKPRSQISLNQVLRTVISKIKESVSFARTSRLTSTIPAFLVTFRTSKRTFTFPNQGKNQIKSQRFTNRFSQTNSSKSYQKRRISQPVFRTKTHLKANTTPLFSDSYFARNRLKKELTSIPCQPKFSSNSLYQTCKIHPLPTT